MSRAPGPRKEHRTWIEYTRQRERDKIRKQLTLPARKPKEKKKKAPIKVPHCSTCVYCYAERQFTFLEKPKKKRRVKKRSIKWQWVCHHPFAKTKNQGRMGNPQIVRSPKEMEPFKTRPRWCPLLPSRNDLTTAAVEVEQ